MESFQSLILLLDSTVRLSIPLLFAALAGLYSERSGIFDIGLEGKMLAAAFAAAAIGAVTGNVWLGLGSAILVSVMLALVHGFACITARGNQIVSGVAINFLAAGLTALIGHAYFQRGGRTPGLDDEARFTPITWPAAEALHDVPFVGPIYFDLISGHNLLVYLGFLAIPITWFVVFRTRFGSAFARGRRKSCRRRYCRYLGHLDALSSRDHLRLLVRTCGRLSLHGAISELRAEHVRW
jgi:ABC-type uncharacterized transport system permease subunit